MSNNNKYKYEISSYFIMIDSSLNLIIKCYIIIILIIIEKHFDKCEVPSIITMINLPIYQCISRYHPNKKIITNSKNLIITKSGKI